jgi:hypothetical protein
MNFTTSSIAVRFTPLAYPQFFHQLKRKILGPACRGNYPVGHGFLQFGAPGASFLRQGEVLLQSGGAPHRHGTTDPDQLTGLGIQHLFIRKIGKKFFFDLHDYAPSR